MNAPEIFNVDETWEWSAQQICEFIDRNPEGFLFRKRIDRARMHTDLTINYLEASYVCETVASAGKWNSFSIHNDAGYDPVAEFLFIPEHQKSSAELLHELGLNLAGENGDPTYWVEELEGYKTELKTRRLLFPDLADGYFGNLIHGSYGEFESGEEEEAALIAGIEREDPEHLFGFWKEVFSEKTEELFYVSSSAWIIPPGTDAEKVLTNHFAADISLNRGNLFSLNGKHFAISEDFVIRLSFAALAKAYQCVSHVFRNEKTYKTMHDWLIELEQTDEVSVSTLGSFICIDHSGHTIILWEQETLNFNEIAELNRQASRIFNTTSALIGLSREIHLDWSELNDETFEELCYDVIYYDPRFDRSTIRKMGKSRSRDGGRDIVVNTRSRMGYNTKKYIFQCKLLTRNNSLTAKGVTDISDTIEQFGAEGYGIFTSGVIDATLFDKIDAIASRRNIKTYLFSRYELERTLSILPGLRERYFKGK